MKLKKLNAALALLAILCILLHVGYSAFAYLTFYYNPVLKNLFAVPFLVLTCLHAVLGMTIVFTQRKGAAWTSTRSRTAGRSCSGLPRR